MSPPHTATVGQSLPQPVVYGLLAVGGLVATAVVVYVVARVGYRLFRLTVRPVRRVLRLVLPDGTATLVAAALVVTAGIGGVSVLVLNADNSLGGGAGVGGQAGKFVDRGLNGNPMGSLKNDGYDPAAGIQAPAYERPMPDADGDRLKDAWERAGETPAGVPLPDADPLHKDLYVVVRYGDRFAPLTPAEKRDLVDFWARMPVSNPDEERGIRLHIVDSPPYGGVQNRTLTFTGDAEGALGAYDELGALQCRYHLVTFAAFDAGDTVGYAGAPGYTALVEGSTNTSYNGSVSRRVHVMTHELLHNVVGRFSGGNIHTDGGWLYGTVRPENEYLPSNIASHLNTNGLQGSGYYQSQVCGNASG